MTDPAGDPAMTSDAALDALSLEALAVEIRRLKLEGRLGAAEAQEALQFLERAARKHFEATVGKDAAERTRLVRTGLERFGAEAGFPRRVHEIVLAKIEGRVPVAEAPAAPPLEPELVPRVTLVRGPRPAEPDGVGAVPPPAPPAAPEPRSEDPAVAEARRERRNLLVGFVIGGIGIIGGSIPLAGLVWRSENDLLKFAAFAGAALLFFAAGQLVERRLGLALAGRTLQTIYLLLVPLVLVVADELRLGGAGFLVSLGLGAAALAASRAPAFGVAFTLLAAANLLVPAAGAAGRGELLAGAAAAVAVAGGLAAVERRVATVRPATAVLALGGLGYATAVVFVRAIARLGVEAAALATPLLITCAPALLAAPRLLGREGEEREGARAAGLSIGAVAATVAFAAYVLSLAHPGSALETASIGTAALIVAAVRRPGAALSGAATLSLGIAYVAGSAWLRGAPSVGWPDLLDPRFATGYLPLAFTLLGAGAAARRSERLRPAAGPPLVAALAVAFAVTGICSGTPALGAALVADALVLGVSAFLLDSAALAALALLALGAVPWARADVLAALGVNGTGLLTAGYGAALVLGGASGGRHPTEDRARFSGRYRPALLAVGVLALAGAGAAHAPFGWLAPAALAAGGLALLTVARRPATFFGALLMAGAVGEAAHLRTPEAWEALLTPLLGLALLYAVVAPRLGRAYDGPLAWVALGLATVLAPAAGFEPAPDAARHLALAAGVYFVLVLAWPKPALVAAGQTVGTAGAMFAISYARRVEGIEAVDPLALAILALGWIGVSAALSRASRERLGGIVERATDLSALDMGCGSAVVMWLAWPAFATTIFTSRAFPPPFLATGESIAALAGAAAAFGILARRVPYKVESHPGCNSHGGAARSRTEAGEFHLGGSRGPLGDCGSVAMAPVPGASGVGVLAEAGSMAAAVVAAAWIVLAGVAPGNRAAVPLATALAAGLYLGLRPSAHRGAPAAVAGLTVTLAVAYALLDLRDGWRITTLLLSGSAITALGTARRNGTLATLGLLVASLAMHAAVAWAGDRLEASDVQTGLAVAASALVAAGLLFETALRRRESEGDALDRPLAAAAATNALAVVASAAVALALALRLGGFVLPGGQTLAGLSVLLALSLGLFRAAVRTCREPLAYAGQLAFAAAVVFLRIARPDIFATEIVRRFWPVILVLLAFAALGLGTILERRGLAVLARPLERVAVVIAVAPAGGVWFVGHGAGSLGLFLSAAFYGALASVRRRPGYAALALALANAGLHPLFLLGGFRYLYEPAVFFGPLGFSLVLAAHFAPDDRPMVESHPECNSAGSLRSPRGFHLGGSRGPPSGCGSSAATPAPEASSVVGLSLETRDLLRTAGAFLVFASLTFGAYVDLSHRTFESLVLAVLCVAGAVAGTRLRIPAYVYLGTAFLVLDVASHIYWAGRDHPWVWWASLVALGVAVIAYFATLERRRSAS